jgi:hypothetical protein
MYSPNSEIKLCSTPLTSDNNHQIHFENVAEQTNYFLNTVKHTFTNCTFVKKDNVLRVPANIENLYDCNYVMYKNAQFTNKYFYAFIKNMKWLNDSTTAIELEVDPWQSWLFWLDLSYQSFIERQHPVVDEINTLADTPAHGQLIESKYIDMDFSGAYFVFCSSDITQDGTTQSVPYAFTIGSYNIPCWCLYFDESEAQKMSTVLQMISNHGYADRILSAVYIPFISNKSNIQLTTIVRSSQQNDLGSDIRIATGFTNGLQDMAGQLDFDFSFAVEKKKALTYPYAKIVLQDSATGQSIELAPEKFAGNIASFQISGTISETPTYTIVPKNYCGQALSYANALKVKCSTTLPTVNAQYAKYFLMNSEQNNLGKILMRIRDELRR